MLQIPYILYRDSRNSENSWTNAPTLGTKYADKSLQIATNPHPLLQHFICTLASILTWGRWGLTMIGA